MSKDAFISKDGLWEIDPENKRYTFLGPGEGQTITPLEYYLSFGMACDDAEAMEVK